MNAVRWWARHWICAMDVLPASTGVIGQPMVIDPFARGIPAAAAKLAHRTGQHRCRDGHYDHRYP